MFARPLKCVLWSAVRHCPPVALLSMMPRTRPAASFLFGPWRHLLRRDQCRRWGSWSVCSMCKQTWHSKVVSHSVLSYSLQPHGLQHARLSCPSLSPRVCSNSCPSSRWCHPTISCSVVPFSCLQSFPESVFSSESVLHASWPKYWSFNFSTSPSNEYSGLISFRMDWLDLLVVQGTLKNLLQKQTKKESSPAPQFESINFSVLSLLYGPSLTMTTGKRQPEVNSCQTWTLFMWLNLLHLSTEFCGFSLFLMVQESGNSSATAIWKLFIWFQDEF